MEDHGSYALTTIDNPYNPFDDFEHWFTWDEMNGYHTCSLLARVAKVSDAMSSAEQESAVEQAIESIIAHDLTNKYRRVEYT